MCKKKLFVIIIIGINFFLWSQSLHIDVKDGYKSNPQIYKYQKWDGESWQDSLIYEYSYFQDSLTIIEKSLDIQDSIIKIDGKLTLIKDQNNNLVKELWQIYDNTWVNSYEYLYSYQDNKIISALYQEWYDEMWTPIYQGFYEYDENDNCTTELWKKWENGTLNDSYVYSYTYDENNNLIGVLYSYWDTQHILTDSYKKTFNYSDTLIVEYKYEKYENNIWENVFKYIYQYNDYNQLSRTDYFTWNINQWENILFAYYTYQGEDLLEELWMYDYQGYNYFYSRNIFNFQTQNGENENLMLNRDFAIKNYPNPFNPTTKIEVTGDIDLTKANIEIFNLKGEFIKKINLNGKKGVFWNGKDSNNKMAQSGLYIFKLNVNGKTEALLKSTLLK